MSHPRDSLVGRVLDGRYRLEECIGRGGMGAVYRARHLMMDHPVAVKLLHGELAEDQTAVRRFAREAKSTFRVDHPHCVRVTDFGVADGGLVYLVMEYLDGRTVHDELECDGAMAAARVAHIARQVCEALDCAHSAGFIHRDLKPENIMLTARGGDPDFAKVLDFGLAKLMTGPGGRVTRAFSAAALTGHGTIFGTPEYMSPEQAGDEPLTPSTDLYSLGVVMYEMLTAERPFSGDTFMAVIAQHVREVPVSPASRRPDLGIPRELDALVMQCLAKNPAGRPAGASALATRLGALAQSLETVSSRLPNAVASSSTVDLAAAAVRAAAHQVAPRGRRLSRGWIVTALGLAVAAAIGVVLALAGQRATSAAADPPTSSASGQDDSGPPVANPPAAKVTARDHERRETALAVDPESVGAARRGPNGENQGGENQSGENQDGAAGAGASSPASAPEVDPAAHREPAGHAEETTKRDPGDSDARRRRLHGHIRRARRAQKSGDLLKHLAEAQAAYDLDRSNTTASYLFGDALVRSGAPRNVARGCQLLHRARALRPARLAHERAECPR